MMNLLHGSRCRDKNPARTDSKFYSRHGTSYLLGGLALVALSAAINIKHAVTHSTADQLDMVLAGGLAFAMTVAFVVLPAIASSAARDRQIAFALAAWIGVLICGGISLTNIAGASMGQRLVTSASATDASDKRTDARKQIAAAESELTTIGTVRPAATVQADIDAKMGSRHDLDGCEAKWLASSKARGVCIDVNALRAELAKSERRASLEAAISAARTTINGTQASSTVGSGDTAAIVAVAAKLGLQVEAETVDLLKSIGIAMGVELFAALLFVAWERARSMGTADATGQPSTSPMTVEPQGCTATPIPVSGAVVSNGVQVPGITASEADCDGVSNASPLHAQKFVDMVANAGGELFGGHRAFAKQLGISHGHVGNVLDALVQAGRIKVEAGRNGTRVRLIDAAA